MIFAVLFVATIAGMFVGLSGYVLLPIIYCLVAAAYCCDLRGLPTFLEPISRHGRLTYSIYMLHVPVTTVFISFLFPRLIGTGHVAQAVSVVAACLILSALAEASFRYFENSARKLLR